MSIINFPILYFPDPLKGKPLFNAKIYVGNPNTDPAVPANQKQLNVVDSSGAVIPVSQPLILSAGGVPIYNGSPVRLDTDGDFSIKILIPPSDQQAYYIESVQDGNAIDPSLIGYYSLSAAIALTLDVGVNVGITDRLNAIYTISSGQTPNGYNVVAMSDPLKQLVYQKSNTTNKADEINAKELGFISDADETQFTGTDQSVFLNWLVNSGLSNKYIITGDKCLVSEVVAMDTRYVTIENNCKWVRFSQLSSSTRPLLKIANQHCRVFNNNQIRSYNDSPDGVVLIGSEDPSAAVTPAQNNILWSFVEGGNVRAAGETGQSGNEQALTRKALAMQSTQGFGTLQAVYSNAFRNVRASHCGVSYYLGAECNGNTIMNGDSYFSGRYVYWLDGIGDGTKSITDNKIIGGFHHFSLNLNSTLYCQSANRNDFVSMSGEPGSGRPYIFDANSNTNNYYGYDNQSSSGLDESGLNNVITNRKMYTPILRSTYLGVTGGKSGVISFHNEDGSSGLGFYAKLKLPDPKFSRHQFVVDIAAQGNASPNISARVIISARSVSGVLSAPVIETIYNLAGSGIPFTDLTVSVNGSDPARLDFSVIAITAPSQHSVKVDYLSTSNVDIIPSFGVDPVN